MAYDYDKTHDSIKESATKHFLSVGFQRASIRQICKDAGVTNGAFYAHFESKEDLFLKLVEPVLAGLKDLYREETERYMEIHSAAEVLQTFERTFSSDRLLVHYIYEHQDTFLLLLKAAGGTAYENFTAQIISEEKEGTIAFLEQCRPYIGRPENLSEDVISQASVFVVSTIFNTFLSGKSESETLRETQLASEFCLAGLKQILSVKLATTSLIAR